MFARPPIGYADLHVHSSGNAVSAETARAVYAALRASGLQVAVLTDHNRVDVARALVARSRDERIPIDGSSLRGMRSRETSIRDRPSCRPGVRRPPRSLAIRPSDVQRREAAAAFTGNPPFRRPTLRRGAVPSPSANVGLGRDRLPQGLRVGGGQGGRGRTVPRLDPESRQGHERPAGSGGPFDLPSQRASLRIW